MIIKYKCKLCNKEFNSVQSLSNHIARGHKQNIKDYYDKFVKSNEMEGKCLNCGNNTTFINYSLGYHKFCSIKCVENNEKIKEKIRNTNIELHGGVGFASEELTNKALNTYNKKHKTNVENFSKVSWDKDTRIKRNKTIKENGKLSKSIETIWKNRTSAEIENIVNKTKQTKKEIYGDENYNNNVKAIKTKIERGNISGFSRKKWKINGIIFDSKFEYNCYCKFIELGLKINPKPKLYFTYIFKEQEHFYCPDFEIFYKNKIYIVESKGLQFYLNHNKDNRMINPYIKKNDKNKQFYDDLMEAKNQCMKNNNVYVITKTEEIYDFLKFINFKEQEFPVISTSLNI